MGKIYKKHIKKYLKLVSRPKRWFALPVIIMLVILAVIVTERNVMNANYTDLLNTIAQGESKGNYNAHYGNTHNSTTTFTDMTVAQVLDWQREYVAQGNPSSAVGKYQFIEPTLRGLVDEMNIDLNARFDADLQDKLAIRLLERRGVHEYLRGNMTREQLAHNLSKEWAALPRVIGANPNSSYYDGDGLNHVQISIEEVFVAIASLDQKNKS